MSFHLQVTAVQLVAIEVAQSVDMQNIFWHNAHGDRSSSWQMKPHLDAARITMKTNHKTFLTENSIENDFLF